MFQYLYLCNIWISLRSLVHPRLPVFLQIIRVNDECKTALSTASHYQYSVMPYGLADASSCFQAFINDVLREFLQKCAIVYLDDILIYYKSLSEHIIQVCKVLLQHILKQRNVSSMYWNSNFSVFVLAQGRWGWRWTIKIIAVARVHEYQGTAEVSRVYEFLPQVY